MLVHIDKHTQLVKYYDTEENYWRCQEPLFLDNIAHDAAC